MADTEIDGRRPGRQGGSDPGGARQPLTVGSLFSGIGGFDLGLERAGMRVVWQVEADPFCRAVLRRHWPTVPCFDDVATVSGPDLGYVDVLCGGFPCQDLSVAGKGAGIDGERSGLWSEYARLIRELRPRYVVVENVAALLGRGLGRVLGDLAACGYDAEWDCVPASAVGAPHRRDRLWIVAYPQRGELRLQPAGQPGGVGASVAGDDGPQGAMADPDGEGPQGHGRPVERAGEVAAAESGAAGGAGEVADTEGQPVGAGLREGGPGGVRGGRPGDSGRPGNAWSAEPDVGRVADGIPNRVDRLSALGNALVPQIAEWIGKRIIETEETG